jgi:hypothetical protein
MSILINQVAEPIIFRLAARGGELIVNEGPLEVVKPMAGHVFDT